MDLLITIGLAVLLSVPAGILGWKYGLVAHKRGVRLAVLDPMNVPIIREGVWPLGMGKVRRSGKG